MIFAREGAWFVLLILLAGVGGLLVAEVSLVLWVAWNIGVAAISWWFGRRAALAVMAQYEEEEK